MASDSRLFVTWASTLIVGMLATRPLMHLGTPTLEMSLMSVTAAAISTRYGVFVRFMVLYTAWLLADAGDHAALGHNGAFAFYVGDHYLSWALVGQARLWWTMTSTGELLWG